MINVNTGGFICQRCGVWTDYNSVHNCVGTDTAQQVAPLI